MGLALLVSRSEGETVISSLDTGDWLMDLSPGAANGAYNSFTGVDAKLNFISIQLTTTVGTSTSPLSVSIWSNDLFGLPGSVLFTLEGADVAQFTSSTQVLTFEAGSDFFIEEGTVYWYSVVVADSWVGPSFAVDFVFDNPEFLAPGWESAVTPAGTIVSGILWGADTTFASALDATAIPEPSTGLLVLVGAGGLMFCRRRWRKG